MPVIADTRLRAVSALADNAFAMAAALVDAFVKARACSAAYEQLSALTDRELDDLGIRRADIATIVRDRVYGS